MEWVLRITQHLCFVLDSIAFVFAEIGCRDVLNGFEWSWAFLRRSFISDWGMMNIFERR